ncbi:MAG: TIGR03905 family TSCPD domain-containing protein, partial [Clostridium sp.]
MFHYKTKGVCSQEIILDVQDGLIKSVDFVKGCPGNLIGISMLVKEMTVDDAISRLQGIQCGNKTTSCPDQ